MTNKNISQNLRPGRTHGGISVFLAAAFLWTNTSGLYAGENRFWQERREASRKMRSAGTEPGFLLASSGPAGLSPEARTFLSTLPQVGSVSLSDQRNGGGSVSGFTSKGFHARPGDPSPVWMKELLACGDVGDIYMSPKPGAPTVFHIQDAHGIQEAQKNISGIMGVLKETREANLVGVEGASGSFTLDPYRKYPSQIVKDVADFILAKGLVGGPEYAGLTLPTAPTLYGVEEGNLYLDNVAALKAAYKERPRVTEILSKIQLATDGLKNKRYSEGLKEYDRHVMAYSSGREDLGTYVRYLAKTVGQNRGRKKGLAIPNVQLLLTALDWEKSLDFKKVEVERLRLVEALVKVVSKPELDALVARSVDYRAGRMGYGEYHRELWDMCERNGIHLKDYEKVMSYINYVLSSEKINRNALITELAILEERAQDDLVETVDQSKLVGIARRLALTEKLFHHEMSMADWSRYQAERSGAMRVKEDLAQLEPSLSTLVALTETDVKPFEDFCSRAVSRNNALVTNLLTKMKSDGAQTGVLVAGGFHTEGITSLLRANETSYVVVTPKISKIPEHSDYLDVLAKDPVPLDKLLAGEKIYLVHSARVADKPLGNDSLRPFWEALFGRLMQIFTAGEYSSDKLAYEAAAVAGELAKEPSQMRHVWTQIFAMGMMSKEALRRVLNKVRSILVEAESKRTIQFMNSYVNVLTLSGILLILVGFFSKIIAPMFILGLIPWLAFIFEQFGYSITWAQLGLSTIGSSILVLLTILVLFSRQVNKIFQKGFTLLNKRLFIFFFKILLIWPVSWFAFQYSPYPVVGGVKIVAFKTEQSEVADFLKRIPPSHLKNLRVIVSAPKYDDETLNHWLGRFQTPNGFFFNASDNDFYQLSSIFYQSNPGYFFHPRLWTLAHEIGHSVMQNVNWDKIHEPNESMFGPDYKRYAVTEYATVTQEEDKAETYMYYRMDTPLLIQYYENGSPRFRMKVLSVAKKFIEEDPSTGDIHWTIYSPDAEPHRLTIPGYRSKEEILDDVNFEKIFEGMINSRQYKDALLLPPDPLQSVFGRLKWAKSTLSRFVVSFFEGFGEEAVFRGGMLFLLSTVGLFHSIWLFPAQALIFGLAHFWAERKLVRSQGGNLTFSQYVFSPAFGNHFLYGAKAGVASFGLFFFSGMLFGDVWADQWVFFLVSLFPGSLHHFINNLLFRMGFDNDGQRRLQSVRPPPVPRYSDALDLESRARAFLGDSPAINFTEALRLTNRALNFWGIEAGSDDELALNDHADDKIVELMNLKRQLIEKNIERSAAQKASLAKPPVFVDSAQRDNLTFKIRKASVAISDFRWQPTRKKYENALKAITEAELFISSLHSFGVTDPELVNDGESIRIKKNEVKEILGTWAESDPFVQVYINPEPEFESTPIAVNYEFIYEEKGPTLFFSEVDGKRSYFVVYKENLSGTGPGFIVKPVKLRDSRPYSNPYGALVQGDPQGGGGFVTSGNPTNLNGILMSLEVDGEENKVKIKSPLGTHLFVVNEVTVPSLFNYMRPRTSTEENVSKELFEKLNTFFQKFNLGVDPGNVRTITESPLLKSLNLEMEVRTDLLNNIDTFLTGLKARKDPNPMNRMINMSQWEDSAEWLRRFFGVYHMVFDVALEGNEVKFLLGKVEKYQPIDWRGFRRIVYVHPIYSNMIGGFKPARTDEVVYVISHNPDIFRKEAQVSLPPEFIAVHEGTHGANAIAPSQMVPAVRAVDSKGSSSYSQMNPFGEEYTAYLKTLIALLEKKMSGTIFDFDFSDVFAGEGFTASYVMQGASLEAHVSAFREVAETISSSLERDDYYGRYYSRNLQGIKAALRQIDPLANKLKFEKDPKTVLELESALLEVFYSMNSDFSILVNKNPKRFHGIVVDLSDKFNMREIGFVPPDLGIWKRPTVDVQTSMGAAGGTFRILERLGLVREGRGGRLGIAIGWAEGIPSGLLVPLVTLIPAMVASGVAVLFGFDVGGFFSSGSWISSTLVPVIGFAVGATLSHKVTEAVFFQLHKRTGIVREDGTVNDNPTDAEILAATRTAMVGFWGAVPGMAGAWMFLMAGTPGMAFLAVGLYVLGVVLAGALHAWKNDRIFQAEFERHFSIASNKTAFESALREAASESIFQALRETPPARFQFLLPRRLSSRAKTVSASWASIVKTATLEKLAALIESMPGSSALISGGGNELTITYVDLAVIQAAKSVDEQKVLAASAVAEIRRAEKDPRRSVVVTHSALDESQPLSVSLGRMLSLPSGISLPHNVSLVPLTEALRSGNGKPNLSLLLKAARVPLGEVGILQLLADPMSLDTSGIRGNILVYITPLRISELFERSLRALEKEVTFA